jgi:hypothetical protein
MKLYFDKQTENVFQINGEGVWAHAIPEDGVLDLDTDKDMEWSFLDGYGDDIEYDGKQMSQIELEKIIRAKLA